MLSRQLYWILASIAVFIATIIMNALSTSGGFGTPNQADLSDKYNLPITPPGWVFSVWGLIYLWQTLWQLWVLIDTLLYASSLSSENKIILTPLFYISWMMSGVGNITWIVLFAFEQIAASTFALILIQISLYVNGYANTKYLAELRNTVNSPQAIANDEAYLKASPFPMFLLKSSLRRMLYTILVNNGIGFYGGWVSVAACLNVALALAFPLDVDKYTASTVALVLLAVLLLVYLVLDFWKFRAELIYTYSPYLILIWALVGIYTKDDLDDLKGIVVALLSLVCVALVGKIVSGVLYEVRSKQNSEVNDTAYTNMNAV